MRKFDFRLQSVLQYREMLEEWTKQTYLECQAERLRQDAELAMICQRRQEMLSHPVLGLTDRLALERVLFSIDDAEHEQRIALGVLLDEEARALALWHERRREAETLRKMRDKAYAEWQLEADRKEQAALDEWASQRRAA